MLILCITAALLLLAAFTRVRVTVGFGGAEPVFGLRIGIIPVRLFPAKPAKKKPARKRRPKAEPARRAEKKPAGARRPPAALIREAAALLRAVLIKFGRHIRIRVLRFDIVVSAPDAAQTALLFSAANNTALFLTEMLVKRYDVRIHQMRVVPDFTGNKPSVDIRAQISMRVWQILSVALSGLAGYMKIKGG